jgi:filamentous hemagglutinin family protein
MNAFLVRRLIPLIGVIANLMAVEAALAQISPDNTLRNPSRVRTNRSTLEITGGTQTGRNLFHSFRTFSVPVGGVASFRQIDPAVTNIFARVTGSGLSRINGLIETLQTDGRLSDANLFFLNPNGIVFGRNAALNVGGSFLATTANQITFQDGTRFSAVNPIESPLLTISVPTGLQFGSAPSQMISRANAPVLNSEGEPLLDSFDTPIRGLNVTPGRTLALVGGAIQLEGSSLFATGGRIELGSISGNDQVDLQVNQQELSLEYESVQNLGDIQISRLSNQTSFIEVSDFQGGSVQIQGRNVGINTASEIIADTIEARGQGIFIRAAELTIDDAIVATTTQGNGRGGNIIVETNRLTLTNAGQIETNTNAIGQGGNLRVTAAETVQLEGGQVVGGVFLASGLFTRIGERAAGRGGKLTVSTDRLQAIDGAQISIDNFGTGEPRRMLIQAREIELAGVGVDRNGAPLTTRNCVLPCPSSFSAFPFSTGNGGSIQVNTVRLRLRDGATIQTPTPTRADAGNLTIHATESIELSGRAADGRTPTGLLTFSGGIPGTRFGEADIGIATATGRGGDLTLRTGELIVRDGAVVAVGSLNRNLAASGAGNLTVQADSIRLDDQAGLLAATNSGNGGNFDLQLSNFLLLSRNSVISATAGSAESGGNGGNIIINLPNGIIATAANQDNDITANAFAGRGGNIRITAENIIGIEPRAATPGNGTNDIDASSRLGAPGTITINSLEVNPSTGLSDLPAAPVTPELAQGCQVETTQASVEFFNTGRGGLPLTPHEPLSHSSILEDLRLPRQTAPLTELAEPESLIEAQGWMTDPHGRVVLVAEPALQPVHCQLQ